MTGLWALAANDVKFAMTAMEHIARAFPEAAVRTHTLLGFAEGLYGYDGAHLRVPDPYGGDTAVYAKCAAVIEEAVLRICEKI